VIATGTPHGVSFPLKDFLKPGDRALKSMVSERS